MVNFTDGFENDGWTMETSDIQIVQSNQNQTPRSGSYFLSYEDNNNDFEQIATYDAETNLGEISGYVYWSPTNDSGFIDFGVGCRVQSDLTLLALTFDSDTVAIQEGTVGNMSTVASTSVSYQPPADQWTKVDFEISEDSNGDVHGVLSIDGNTWDTGYGSTSQTSNGKFALGCFQSINTGSAGGFDDVSVTEVGASAPSSPSNVSLSYVADDQLDLSWEEVSDWGGEVGSYNVDISRDGAGYVNCAGGPTNVSGGSASYTKAYGPNSDNSYDSVVGIDSSFQMRVQAQNSAGTSSWVESDPEWTSPITPHQPGVNRPDGDTLEISSSLQATLTGGREVQYREDTGGGYGTWTNLTESHVNLDGSDDYAAIEGLNYSTSGAITQGTWAAWIRTTKSSEAIIASYDASEYWRFRTEGVASVYIGDNYRDGTIRVDDGNWHHIAAVYDGGAGTVDIYVDGIHDTQHTGVPSSAGSGTTRYGFIGTGSEAGSYNGGTGPGNYWNGDLDNIYWAEDVLTQSEIKRLAAGEQIDKGNLQFYFTADEGSGTVLNDQSGNVYDANFQNGPTAWNTHSDIREAPVTLSTSNVLSQDARYQVRARNVVAGRTSAWVYADYGNENNVYFEDDFESGDFSNWDTSGVSDADSGVKSGEEPGGDSGISGADSGTYYAHLESVDYIDKDLGDLSGETDVIVRATIASGSLDGDSATDDSEIRWYDGSSWSRLVNHGWEYNKQGWVQVTALVPDSKLSTDNRLRLQCNQNGSGDYSEFDNVIVSDVLHEYTKPAAQSNYTLDNTVEREITASWTNNHAFPFSIDMYIRKYNSGNSYSKTVIEDDVNSHTWTGLDDGEKYETYTRVFREQNRHGSRSDGWITSISSVTSTTILPPVTNAQVESIDGDSYNLSWDSTTNNGTFEILISATGGSSFVTDGNTYSSGDRSGSTTDYNSDNTHIMKVRLTTGHKSVESAQTAEYILAGSVNRTDAAGVVEDEQPGVIMTDK